MVKISVKEAAALLRVHVNTIKRYVKAKLLTTYQVVPGGNVRLDKEQVEKLFKAVK